MPEQIPLIDPSGAVVGVEPENLARFLGQGYRPLTLEEQTSVADEQHEAALYNSPEHTIQAFGQGINRGLTYGLSDLLVDGEEASKLRKHHSLASGIGEATGAVAGGLAGASGRAATGLAGQAALSAPSALSARAAQTVARRVAGQEVGRTALQRVVGGAVEAAVDGGLYGAGQAVSSAALGEDPITIERLAASVATGALFGGAIGGGLGAVGAASSAIRKKLVAKANPLLNPRSSGSKELGEHIGKLAREVDKGVDDALAAAAERLRNERAGQLIEQHAATGPVGINTGAVPRARGGLARFAAEAQSGPIIPPGASKDLVGGAFVPPGVDPVEHWQGVAARDAQDSVPPVAPANTAVVGRNKFKDVKQTQAGLQPGWRTPDLQPHFDEAVIQPSFTVPDALAAAEQVSKQEFGELRKRVAVARRGLVDRFGKDFDVDMAALVRKPSSQAFKSIQAWDDWAAALKDVDKAAGTSLATHLDDPQHIVGSLARTTKDPELARALENIGKMDRRGIADALKLDVSKLPPATSPVADLMLRTYAAGRFAEGFGAKAAVKVAESKINFGMLGNAMGGALFGGLPGAATAAVLFALGNPNRSLGRLLTAAGKVAVKFSEGIDNFVQRVTSGKAQRVANLSAQSILAEVRFSEEKEDTSVAVPVRRMRELQQLLSNPARLEAYVDDQLAPLRAHNLDVGFGVADAIKMRLRFYGTKMPSLPPPDPFTGFQEEPSDGEVRDWARYVAAGERPDILLQELAARDLNPETVETLQAVYPALYGEMQAKLAEAIPDIREKLEYADKLNLSLLYDVPVEQTATDDMFFSLQEMHQLRTEEEQKQAAKPMQGTPKPYAPTKGQLLTDR